MYNTYVCCFCGKTIASNDIDITSLSLTSNWDKDESLQNTQNLFCHFLCFKSKVLPDIPLYIEDLLEEISDYES